MNEEQAILQRRLQHLLIDVFNIPTQDDLLLISSPTRWTYKGTELPEANILELKNQADKFLNSELYKVIKTAILHDAGQRAVNKSQTESDLIAAKIEVYMLNLIETMLKHMTQ
jgi:hypothetical protein